MKQDLETTLQTISEMIARSANTKAKFASGSSQDTLQKNRVKALTIASELVKAEFGQVNNINSYSKNELEKALAPIQSLISKSEKTMQKLATNSWQHKMLERNLNALYIVLPLLQMHLEI